MTIKIDGIDRALSRIRQTSSSLEPALSEVAQKAVNLGVSEAQIGFGTVLYAGDTAVNVYVESTPDSYDVVAEGVSVAFIEYGAGVNYAEHPLADKFGLHHGTYGAGKGATGKKWGYKGKQGTTGIYVRTNKSGESIYLTDGNPANAVMYNTSQAMREAIKEFGKEYNK